jgi:hypothetical protein
MIEASQRMITINSQGGELGGINPAINRHFELGIKTLLQTAPRDEEKLERLLKIRIKLAKDPTDYAVNHPNKKIGMLLGAKAGDVTVLQDKDVSGN